MLLAEGMSTGGQRRTRPLIDSDAGDLARRGRLDPAVIQVAVLALLAILLLTTTAYLNCSGGRP
jgi:hypothetical protein